MREHKLFTEMNEMKPFSTKVLLVCAEKNSKSNRSKTSNKQGFEKTHHLQRLRFVMSNPVVNAGLHRPNETEGLLDFFPQQLVVIESADGVQETQVGIDSQRFHVCREQQLNSN